VRELTHAKPQDASALVDLYAKAFDHTGFKQFTRPEKRGELVALVEVLCRDGKLWFVADDSGPAAFGHYEPNKDEVITIATRDDAEGKGFAKAVLQSFSTMNARLKLRPVTKGGKSLARSCGFAPTREDGSLWVRLSHG
jgi:GNAT superfamily N-acetyltransferase